MGFRMLMSSVLAGAIPWAFLGCDAITGQVRVSDTSVTGEEGAAGRTEEDAGESEEHSDGEENANEPETETPCPEDEFVSPVGLPTGVVTIGEHVFHVEIPDTREAQIRGLMERESLAPNAGMLFIFEQPEVQTFWMLNTPLPLDVAFIREDLTISSTDTMEPLTTVFHVSIEPVLYVLEVPAGEFARRGIEAGQVISITRD